MEELLKDQTEKHTCPNCGDVISVNDKKCYACGYTAEPKVK